VLQDETILNPEFGGTPRSLNAVQFWIHWSCIARYQAASDCLEQYRMYRWSYPRYDRSAHVVLCSMFCVPCSMFCTHLYGWQSAKNIAKKVLKVLQLCWCNEGTNTSFISIIKSVRVYLQLSGWKTEKLLGITVNLLNIL
jgi:hypothetical protein